MMMLMDALQGLVSVDTDIFLFFNGMHNTFWDYFMSAYSGKWQWIPMYAALLYVIGRNLSWRTALMCVIGVALGITFADQVCATLIRPYVERMRPSNLDNPISEMVHIVNNHRGGRYGFPSCHSANTFGLAFYLFFLFRRRWLTFFMMAWAVLTCYSRVYLGVQNQCDLLAGMLVGLAGACLVFFLFRKGSGYKRAGHVTHANVPILTGGLTVVVMLGYAAAMSA